MEKRKYLNGSEKAQVIDRQRGLCACGCGEKLELGLIDFDHELALQFGGSNRLSNFVALIRKHHRAKSNDENTKRAKCDRQRAKFFNPRLSSSDRDAARIIERTKQSSSRDAERKGA
jgi:5-methylcytosine-specific restriction protein A